MSIENMFISLIELDILLIMILYTIVTHTNPKSRWGAYGSSAPMLPSISFKIIYTPLLLIIMLQEKLEYLFFHTLLKEQNNSKTC